MKRVIIIFLLILFKISFGQDYFQTTTSSANSNTTIKHQGKIIIGDQKSNSSIHPFQLYSNQNNTNIAAIIGNNSGRFEIAVGGCSGCFGAFQPGDGIIRKLGSSHNIRLFMPNTLNDGASEITIGDATNKRTFKVLNNGKVTIGNNITWDNEDFKLYVEDGIRTEKVKVDIASENGWADYVFENDYNLMDLKKLKNYISENKHLPEIPSAREAIEKGVELKEMNIKLLKKVEELTLYLIEQNEKIELMEEKVKSLEEKLNKE